MKYTNFAVSLFILYFADTTFSQYNISNEDLTDKSTFIRNWNYCENDSVNCFTNPNAERWHELKVSTDSKYLDLPEAKTYWLSTRITLPPSLSDGLNLSITLYTPGSAIEVYWNGNLINQNGTVGENLSSEIPGKVLQNINLPSPIVVQGRHLLSIHVSNFHQVDSRIKNLASIGTYKNSNQDIDTRNYSIIIIASVFFTSAIFSLIFFFGFNKNPAYLFFTLFSFSFTLKTILEGVTLFPEMNVTNFDTLISFVYPVVLISGILLVAFLSYKFSLKRKKEIIISFVVFSLTSYPLLAMRYYIVAMIVAAILIVLYSTYKKMEGSLLSLTGLIGFSLFTYLGYREILNYGYFAGVIFFIFCIMISLARQIATQNFLHNQAVTRALRLESQLLKKNIQPHFILNSLTSLQELVEQSPKKAIELIDSLSDEFRMMSKISGEKLIPIPDELAICNAHLKIMEFRKESKFKFETKNIDGNEMIPPALFHTLVENGITHGYGSKGNGYFLLTKENIENGIRYKLFNDSEPGENFRNEKIGTGIKYIEARLEESYPGYWKFEQYRVDNGWQAVIEINNSKRNNHH